MFPLGKLHGAKQQRDRACCRRSLCGRALQQQSSGSLPGLGGDAGCQHPHTILLHQQGLGEFQLQQLWSQILCGVHFFRHSCLCSSFQGVDCANLTGHLCHAQWSGNSVRRGRSAPYFRRGNNYLEQEEDGVIETPSHVLEFVPYWISFSTESILDLSGTTNVNDQSSSVILATFTLRRRIMLNLTIT